MAQAAAIPHLPFVMEDNRHSQRVSASAREAAARKTSAPSPAQAQSHMSQGFPEINPAAIEVLRQGQTPTQTGAFIAAHRAGLHIRM